MIVYHIIRFRDSWAIENVDGSVVLYGFSGWLEACLFAADLAERVLSKEI